MESVVIDAIIPVSSEDIIVSPALAEVQFSVVNDAVALEHGSTLEEDAQSAAEETAAVESILEDNESEPELDEIAVGSRFNNYDAFMTSLERYSERQQVAYVTGQTKSVEYYNKSCRQPLPTALRFTHMRLVCKHGGPARRTSLGLRPNQTSYKLECPSYLMVAADRKTAQLVVRTFVEEHNHELGLAIVSPRGRPRRSLPRAKRNTLGAQSEKSPSSQRERKQKPSARQPIKVERKRRAPTPVPVKREKRSAQDDQPPDDDQQYHDEGNDWHEAQMCGDSALERSVAADDDDDVMEVEASDLLAGDEEGGEGGAVARVNSAWQCVYMLLETDHRALQARLRRLRDENTRLVQALDNATASAAGASSLCPNCGFHSSSPKEPKRSGRKSKKASEAK